MIIKKFQAKTENEAVEAAKKELGAGVVIMNVKTVKKKGIFSFLKPAIVEVTVALEEENERTAATPPKQQVQPMTALEQLARAQEAARKEEKAEKEIISIYTICEF